MKECFSKILAILFSLIIMFSTLSFSTIIHFCGGEAVGVSYFGKADTCSDIELSCCKEKEKITQFCYPNLTNCDDAHIIETPCCSDLNKNIDNTVYNNSVLKNTITKALITFLSISYFSVEYTYKTNSFYNTITYLFPILNYDFQVIFQTFII